MIKINKDGFVWKVIPKEKAEAVFNSGLFELYVLFDDDSEALIQSIESLKNTIECNDTIGIEVGNINKTIKNQYDKDLKVFCIYKKESNSQYTYIAAKNKQEAIEYAHENELAWTENQDYSSEITDIDEVTQKKEWHHKIIHVNDNTTILGRHLIESYEQRSNKMDRYSD